MEAYVFVVVWSVGRWREPVRVAEAWIPPALICALGLLAEVGATRGEPAQILIPEAATMFILVTALTLWIGRTSSSPLTGRQVACAGDASGTRTARRVGVRDD
jgi:hypothetical protein